jgi:branched-chain amino acid transport system permease protein
MEYVIHIAVVTLLYAILAVSLDLMAGHAGLLSLAHAGFFGIGAYVSAICAVETETPFVLELVFSGVVAGSVAAAVGWPLLRLKGDLFVIGTLSVQMVLLSVFNNWMSVTRGPLGIAGIPIPVVFGWRVDSPADFVVLCLPCAAIAFCVTARLTSGPYGRVLHAIREDETFAKSLGKNVAGYKLAVFVVGAMLAAGAGGIYARYVSYVDPTSFTVMESILVLSMVIVGGAGSMWGPLVGAVVLVVLPEALRFLGLPAAVAANLRQIIYGSLLVVMMLVRPQGLVGRYAFGR